MISHLRDSDTKALRFVFLLQWQQRGMVYKKEGNGHFSACTCLPLAMSSPFAVCVETPEQEHLGCASCQLQLGCGCVIALLVAGLSLKIFGLRPMTSVRDSAVACRWHVDSMQKKRALDFKTASSDFSPKFSNLTPFFSIKLAITQADVVHLKWDEFSSEEWMMQVEAGGAALVPLHPINTRTILAVVGPTRELWTL